MKADDEKRGRAPAGVVAGAAALFALAVVPRLYLALTRNPSLVGDELSYFACAANLVAGRGFVIGPPAYAIHFLLAPAFPAFLAPFAAAWGPAAPRFAFVALAVLNAAAVIPVAAAARRQGGVTAGAAAGVFYALHPYLIFYGTRLLTEALAIPLFAVFLWFYAEDDARSWRWALAGAATGLVVLTRAVFLYVGLTAWAAVLIADRGRPLRRRFVNVAVAAAIAAAVVSPWVIRNYILAGRFILVTENAGTVLYQHNRFLEPGAPSLWGVAETPAFRAYIARYPADPVTRELAHQDYLKARALEIIRAQPAAYAAACGRRVFHFFSPTPDLADRVSENAPLFRLLPFVFVYNIALLLAGAAGVVRAPAARWRWFFLGTLVVVTLIHAATISLLRYRLPVDEAFTVAAGFGVAAVFRRRRAAGP